MPMPGPAAGRFLLQDRGSRPRPLPAGVRRRHLRGSASGSASTWDGEPIVQSERTELYQQALDRLKADRLVYACFCTRAEIAQSLTAPHGDAGSLYPGTCRPLPDDPERRASDAALLAARFGAGRWNWPACRAGPRRAASDSGASRATSATRSSPARTRPPPTISPAWSMMPTSGVNLVVRGEDLRPSTPTQRLLQLLLGLPEPTYLHHPLVTHEDGRRLAKRDQAPTLQAMRESGVDGRALAAELLEGRLPLGFRLSQA